MDKVSFNSEKALEKELQVGTSSTRQMLQQMCSLKNENNFTRSLLGNVKLVWIARDSPCRNAIVYHLPSQETQ